MANETVPSMERNVAIDKEINEALKACDLDRTALETQVGLLFQTMWTESIRVVEELLRNSPAAAKDNDRLLKAYRSRLLNEGNRLKRTLKPILDGYLVQQVYATEVKTRRLPCNPNDPWGLPKGCRFPDRS